MRFGLIILGIIFLVIGGILFLYPSQTFSTQTNSAPIGESNVRNSSAILDIPVEWSYGLMIMGILFLILGLAVPNNTPNHTQIVTGPRGPRGSRGIAAKKPIRRVRRSKATTLPSGTSVTTTTRIQRRR